MLMAMHRFLLVFWLLFWVDGVVVTNSSFASEIDPTVLAREILERAQRVDSFQFIASEAQKLGLRVYLFGGSAAAYAHYVHWDLMREAGDARFHADRFTYAYVDIFRSNQDMDIVVDGSSEQAHVLERQLAQKFPFFQGNKSVWELRLLRADRGDKQALLNNPDFLNQHTDSNSTALIELSTRPDLAQIRDLRDWNNPGLCQFLEDVQAQKLHYYYSDAHDTTSRFKQGMNPPILSVIRYLTKAFQYELAIDLETKLLLKTIIADFDYGALEHSYVKKWINNNGKKLYQNAVNLEYASQVLDELGLKAKLLQIGSAYNSDDLAWWMHKEPLHARKLGQGHGKTAAELGLDIVSHETRSFSAWESITKSHENVPNVFISRHNGNGETAAHGDGFYTRIGRFGARGTGITIRFKLHPQARVGEDFSVHGDYIVIKNKNALQVIHEDLSMGVVEYFEMLMSGFEFDHADKAVKYKLKQKVLKQVSTISVNNRERLNHLMRTYAANPESKNATVVYEEWMLLFDFPGQWMPSPLDYVKAIAQKLDTQAIDPKALQRLKLGIKNQLQAMSAQEMKVLDRQLLPVFKKLASYRHGYACESLEELLKYGLGEFNDTKLVVQLLDYFFLRAQPNTIPEPIEPYLKAKNSRLLNALSMYTLADPNLEISEEIIKLILDDIDLSKTRNLLEHVFSKPHAVRMQSSIRYYLEKVEQDSINFASDYIFSKPHAKEMPELVQLLVERASERRLPYVIERVFSKPHAQSMPEIIHMAAQKADIHGLRNLVDYVFSQPHTSNMQATLEFIINNSNHTEISSRLIHSVFSEPHTSHMNDLLMLAIQKTHESVLYQFAVDVFSKPHTADKYEALKFLIEKGDSRTLGALAQHTFSKPHTAGMGDLLELLIHKEEGYSAYIALAKYTFSQPHTEPMKHLLKVLIENGGPGVLQALAEYTFSQPHTQNMPELYRLLIERADEFTLKKLATHVFSKPHTDKIVELKVMINGLNDVSVVDWPKYIQRELAKLPDLSKTKGTCLQSKLMGNLYRISDFYP